MISSKHVTLSGFGKVEYAAQHEELSLSKLWKHRF
jgi:hypothetical protein